MLELEPRDRVLVRLPSWLGDLVAVEPAVEALARAVGEERLSLAAPGHLLPLLSAWLPRARRIPHRGRGGERASDWRGHRAAILLTGSFRSAWTALRAGIPLRAGWLRDGRGWLLTHGAHPPLERGRPAVGRGVARGWPRILPRPVTASAVELVQALGVPVARTVTRLPLVERARERVERELGPSLRPLVANVGGREGSAKRWPTERWVATLALLADLGPFWLVCGPGEEHGREAVAAGLAERGVAVERAWPDRPADLPELAALCARASLVLSADSGPRHVARAVGAPTVTLFGPTDPRHTLAPGPPERRLRVDVDCGPCHREVCPLAGADRLRCWTRLEPDRVATAARSIAGHGGW